MTADGGLAFLGAAGWLIALVYVLAFAGFALYVVGAFIKNKEVGTVAADEDTTKTKVSF